MDKASALRKAKLEYMQEAKGILAHPAFWSPFIQLGDSKAIYLKTKGGTSYWILGVIGIISVLLTLVFWFKKNK